MEELELIKKQFSSNQICMFLNGLSKLAIALDSTGGGHANACGCRIQPRDSSTGKLTQLDKQYNLEKWLELWADREIKLLKN